MLKTIKTAEIELLLKGADEEKKEDDYEDRAGGGAVGVGLLEKLLFAQYM